MSMNSPLDGAALDHGASMDRIYGVQRHFYDVTRAYYLLGRDPMLDGLKVPQNGSVLEVGCGTGRNLAGVARRFATARLFGFDISKEMLASAETSMARAGLSAKLALADASDFNAMKLFGEAQFDRVFFSYTLSMIPDWRAALALGLKALKPGGSLHVADFGDCAGLPAAFKSALYAWLGKFHVTPRQALAAELYAMAEAAGGRVEISTPYRGYAIVAKVKCA